MAGWSRKPTRMGTILAKKGAKSLAVISSRVLSPAKAKARLGASWMRPRR